MQVLYLNLMAKLGKLDSHPPSTSRSFNKTCPACEPQADVPTGLHPRGPLYARQSSPWVMLGVRFIELEIEYCRILSLC